MKQMVKGSATLTAVSLGEMAMRFVRTKFIALILGPAGMGFLAQLTIFFELLRVWGDLGSRRGVIKQIAELRKEGKQSARYGEIIRTSYILAVAASTLTGLIVTVFSKEISLSLYGTPDHAMYIISLAFLLPFASVSTVTASIVKGNLEYASFAKYTIAAYAVVMVLTPAVVYFFHYWGAVVIQALFFIVPMISYLIFNSRHKFIIFSKKINVPAMREQFSYGFVQIYQDSLLQVTRVVVAAWIVKGMGLSSMGLYQVIITFSTVYMAIPIQAMSGYAMPLISAAANQKEVVRAINDALRFLMFLIVPIISVVMIWPETFIYFFFSRDFMAAAMPLQVQLLGTFFLLVGFPFCVAFQARGQLKALLIIATLSPLLYLGTVWLCYDLGQLTGIAFAFFLTNAIMAVVQFVMAKHYFDLHIVPKNVRLLWVSAAWVAFAFLAGAFLKVWVLRLLVTALIIPWFFLSSKKHEREFITVKWNRVREFARGFFAEKHRLLKSLKL